MTGRGTRIWLVAVAAALTLLAGPAPATEPGFPRPTEAQLNRLLAAAGLAARPADGRVLRYWWEDGINLLGEVDILILADGRTLLSASWMKAPATAMQPGDLAPFEALLAKADFPDRDRVKTCSCVDNCSDFHFQVIASGRSDEAFVCSDELGAALNELSEIVGARSGQGLAAPRPWWSPLVYQATGPPPDPGGLISALFPKPPAVGWYERGYRLTVWRGDGAPEVVQVALDRDHRLDQCLTFPWCDLNSPNRALLRSTARPWPRRIGIEKIEAFEGVLDEAGFATLPRDPGDGACVSDLRWSLEALRDHRYRVLNGSGCDRRGLGPALDQLLRLGGAAPLP